MTNFFGETVETVEENFASLETEVFGWLSIGGLLAGAVGGVVFGMSVKCSKE